MGMSCVDMSSGYIARSGNAESYADSVELFQELLGCSLQ